MIFALSRVTKVMLFIENLEVGIGMLISELIRLISPASINCRQFRLICVNLD